MDTIDLHTHSTFSDGTFTPLQLVKYAEEKGLKAFAITDHDTTEGIKEAKSIETNVEVISGVEISTRYDKKEIHIVGLYVNENDADLNKQLKYYREKRVTRNFEILEKLNFYDYAISLKASNLDLCIESYEEAAKEFDCPLHLGITESGTEFSGTIKSSIGLGYMLRQGIGDTIRVSLSDDPVKEIKVAKEILKVCKLFHKSPTLVACPTCGRTQIDLIPMAKKVEEFLQTIESDITVAVMGCAVNGPGEARGADIGIAGGIKEGLLFKKGEVVRKIPQEHIVEELKKEILEMVNNK